MMAFVASNDQHGNEIMRVMLSAEPGKQTVASCQNLRINCAPAHLQPDTRPGRYDHRHRFHYFADTTPSQRQEEHLEWQQELLLASHEPDTAYPTQEQSQREKRQANSLLHDRQDPVKRPSREKSRREESQREQSKREVSQRERSLLKKSQQVKLQWEASQQEETEQVEYEEERSQRKKVLKESSQLKMKSLPVRSQEEGSLLKKSPQVKSQWERSQQEEAEQVEYEQERSQRKKVLKESSQLKKQALPVRSQEEGSLLKKSPQVKSQWEELQPGEYEQEEYEKKRSQRKKVLEESSPPEKKSLQVRSQQEGSMLKTSQESQPEEYEQKLSQRKKVLKESSQLKMKSLPVRSQQDGSLEKKSQQVKSQWVDFQQEEYEQEVSQRAKALVESSELKKKSLRVRSQQEGSLQEISQEDKSPPERCQRERSEQEKPHQMRFQREGSQLEKPNRECSQRERSQKKVSQQELEQRAKLSKQERSQDGRPKQEKTRQMKSPQQEHSELEDFQQRDKYKQEKLQMDKSQQHKKSKELDKLQASQEKLAQKKPKSERSDQQQQQSESTLDMQNLSLAESALWNSVEVNAHSTLLSTHKSQEKIYQRRNSANGSTKAPSSPFYSWLAAKNEAQQQQALDRRLNAQLEDQRAEERARLAQQKYEHWCQAKTSQLRRAKSDLSSMQTATTSRQSLSATEAQRRLVDWERDKLAELKAQRAEREALAAQQQQIETTRRELSSEAWEQWMESTRNRPKPVAMGRGLDSLRATNAPLYSNPNEWQPLLGKKHQSNQSQAAPSSHTPQLRSGPDYERLERLAQPRRKRTCNETSRQLARPEDEAEQPAEVVTGEQLEQPLNATDSCLLRPQRSPIVWSKSNAQRVREMRRGGTVPQPEGQLRDDQLEQLRIQQDLQNNKVLPRKFQQKRDQLRKKLKAWVEEGKPLPERLPSDSCPNAQQDLKLELKQELKQQQRRVVYVEEVARSQRQNGRKNSLNESCAQRSEEQSHSIAGKSSGTQQRARSTEPKRLLKTRDSKDANRSKPWR